MELPSGEFPSWNALIVFTQKLKRSPFVPGVSVHKERSLNEMIARSSQSCILKHRERYMDGWSPAVLNWRHSRGWWIYLSACTLASLSQQEARQQLLEGAEFLKKLRVSETLRLCDSRPGALNWEQKKSFGGSERRWFWLESIERVLGKKSFVQESIEQELLLDKEFARI